MENVWKSQFYITIIVRLKSHIYFIQEKCFHLQKRKQHDTFSLLLHISKKKSNTKCPNESKEKSYSKQFY